MAETHLRRESPVEYFKSLIDVAMERQRLAAGELTSFYLVNLLAGFVFPDPGDDDDEPLGIRLARALQAGGTEQREALRRVGDRSLFVAGFFADSLSRRVVDVDYYIALGECAYGSLARKGNGTFPGVFDELAGNFGAFVDVLGEVSERSALTSSSDLLRLYERWLRTGSRHSGERLVSRGILPNATIGTRFLQ